MQYKTIALEIIQDRPELYEQLRSTNRLLTAIEAYGAELRASHEMWKDEIATRWPGSDPAQVASQALELAIEVLTRRLPSESPEEEADSLSLDEAISYVRQLTPAA